jgi:hypothetical protein
MIQLITPPAIFLALQTQKLLDLSEACYSHGGGKTMNRKQLIAKEIAQVPEPLLEEVLDFVRFLKSKRTQEKLETSLLSESSLKKDWLSPEEEKAWQHL